MTKCAWIFNCDTIPKWIVYTGAHNDPKPMCTKHKDATEESLRQQGYYARYHRIEDES